MIGARLGEPGLHPPGKGIVVTQEPVPSGELLGRLREAYSGEVNGAILFDELAARAVDDYQREVYAVHQQVEATTRDALKPVLARYGLPAAEEPDARYAGFLKFFTDRSWDAIWKDLEPQLAGAVDRFRAIRDALDPADPGLVALVVHEESLLAFSRAEQAGERTTALDPMRAYLATHGSAS